VTAPDAVTAPEVADPASAGFGPARTGHPDVDAALASLAGLEAVPPAEQVERYTEVHRRMQQTLRTIDAT